MAGAVGILLLPTPFSVRKKSVARRNHITERRRSGNR